MKGVSVIESVDTDILEIAEGLEREALVKIRVNQAFFRKSVLASYSSRCCITGITIPQLLVASHIVPWSVDRKNRMNPSNGLCLNALHDRAFDAGLITITTDLRLKLSSEIKEKDQGNPASMFTPYDNRNIQPPQKFFPALELLEYHNKHIFVDN
jgi:putative restriction endonuclease